MRMEQLKNEFPEMPEELRERIRREVAAQMSQEGLGADEMERNTADEETAGAFPGYEAGRTEITAKEETTGTFSGYKAKRPEEDSEGMEYLQAADRRRRSYGYEADSVKTAGGRRKGRKKWKTAAAVILAATVALGTTAFAGVKLYQLYMEEVGTYGRKISLESQEETAMETVYENPTIATDYLPEGMVQEEGELKYYYEDQRWIGGISVILYRIDTEEPLELVEKDIVDSEQITVSSHDALYLARPEEDGDTVVFDKNMFIYYQEADIVAEIMAANNVSQEELLKFAEGIRMVEAEDGERQAWVSWSQFADAEEETELYTALLTVGEEDLLIHEVGESFSVNSACSLEEDGVWDYTKDTSVTVTSVEILDNLSLLDSQWIDSMLAAQADEEGNLLPDKISYIKRGDGIDTIDETVAVSEVSQKLVYVTVDYTNTGEDTLYDICYNGYLLKLRQEDGAYTIVDSILDKSGTNSLTDSILDESQTDSLTDSILDESQTDSPAGTALDEEAQDWDSVSHSGLRLGGMIYYDVRKTDSNGGNYIEVLEPGETKTLHMGFLVDENELDSLYLSLGSSGSGYEFTEKNLEDGYVDIRQE